MHRFKRESQIFNSSASTLRLKWPTTYAAYSLRFVSFRIFSRLLFRGKLTFMAAYVCRAVKLINHNG